jgi:DNA polymerase-1
VSLLRAVVAGDPVKVFHLPPASVKFTDKFFNFANSNSIFGFDVETTSIDEMMGSFDPAMKLRTVQFGSRDTAWVLDAHNLFWRTAICNIINDNAKKFVSHSNYDPLWVEREFGVKLGPRSLDTLPMAKLLRPSDRGGNDLKLLSSVFIDSGLQAGEDALIKRFRELAPTGSRVGKTLKSWGFTNIPLDDKIFGMYAGLDAIYVRRMYDILLAEMNKRDCVPLHDREQQIQRICTDSQIRGQRLDIDYTEDLLREIEDEYLEADGRLRETFGFTPLSPRVGPWLQQHGVEFYDFTPTGAPKLDKETLPDIARIYKDDKILGPILADKVLLSERKNLLANLRNVRNAVDSNGFVHPRINTQAAITGRMSIVSPAMQTFKKRDPRLRGCFISREGFIFVGADYNGQETRIGAAFSSDPALLEIVTHGLSMHKMTAKLIFGDNYTPEQYDQAKVLDFAQQYGAGPKTIARQLGIKMSEARKLWNAWRKAYKQLVEWTDYMATFSSVVNPWGREIPSDPRRKYANGNYAIQSSGRDVLGDAITALHDCGLGKYFWLPIHDEIVLEVPEKIAERARRALERKMYAKLGQVELTAEAKIIGHRWNGL